MSAARPATAAANPNEVKAHMKTIKQTLLLTFCTLLASLAVAPSAFALWETEAEGSLLDATGNPVTQAGDHPNFYVRMNFSEEEDVEGFLRPSGNLKDSEVELPAGMIGNPNVVPKCPRSDLGNNVFDPMLCSKDSQVGELFLGVNFIGSPYFYFPATAIYNLVPQKGNPAQFGFNINGVIGILTPELRNNGTYRLNTSLRSASYAFALSAVGVELWGVPADPSHDLTRGGASSQPRKPFFTLPTRCTQTPLAVDVRTNSWQEPDNWAVTSYDEDESGNPFTVDGCDSLPFAPSLEVAPSTNVADAPTGLDVNLEIPQNEDPDGVAAAHLRDARIVFPEGLSVNPSSANGLGACSPEQISLDDNAVPTCPDSSKIGTVEVDTPLVDHTLDGSAYLATQGDNPFGSLLAIYLTIVDPKTGTVIKLPGRVDPDPQTGRMTVSFEQNPQVPFQELRVSLFGGARASLRTPLTCGSFTTTSTMTPWSSPEGADASPSDSFAIEQGGGGSACVSDAGKAPNSPTFTAGTVDPTAGAFTPFALKVSRADGTQELGAIDTTLPQGLLGKLAGVPYCPDGALAAASNRSGKAEQASPSCPAASRVGFVTIGAGAGPTPLYVQGQAYLAGPYKGAPLSLAVVTPAVAGPFDLGTVVVRVALQVDPGTTQIRAVSDPLPRILQGIPLDIRSVALSVDRPDFIRNPTSCEPSSVAGLVTTTLGQSTGLSNPFQVGDCAKLAFKPKLKLNLKGATKRSGFPALRAELRAGGLQEANIASASVALPHAEFLAQQHIRTVCTRVQFAANQCPAGSIYGKATAFSPLLDQPLEGPVYLRSSNNPLPDLVAALRGQIGVDLVGRIDSVKGGIRTTFDVVPDAPVSKFVLQMQGGKKGLLQNSRNLCASVNRAVAQFTAHNGRGAELRPVLGSGCKKARKGGKKKGGGRR